MSLNGTPLGEVRWTGITAQQGQFAIPPGTLLESGNQVEVTALTGDGAPYSIVYVDSFDLSYPRAFRAAADALAFTAGGNSQATVTGFSSPSVRLIDVQDPLHPRWITGATVEPDGASGYGLSFAPRSRAYLRGGAGWPSRPRRPAPGPRRRCARPATAPTTW